MSFSFLKSTFAAETSQSRSADSGSNAESSSSTDIFRNILNAPKAARSSSEHPPLPTPKQLSPINQRGSCTPDTRSISSSSQSNSESSLNEKYGAASKTELGHGATAIVRLCISMSGDNKKYAIKEFNSKKKNEDQKSYIKKLTSEFNISSSLLHENIVRTVDLIQDDRKKWCAVMEYSEGGDLFSKIQGGSLHDQTLIDCFFKQIVAGVAYLHAVGVAHRDLKPENILLDKSCRILKITDFGVSTVFHLPLETKSTKCIGQCGSGPYMAPEVYLLKPYDPALVDVWSIGIIYYVMTFSSMPWLESRISDMRYKKYLDAFGAFGPIERLSPLKRQLMYRMIHPDVKKRINICKITSSEWISKISVCREGTSESEGGVTHSHACLSVL
ncbi:kinase-like domain-containing protein [Obelidium mucronatum]|nr:kinase-like domain-containing protein [Obelidium mucronatum]